MRHSHVLGEIEFSASHYLCQHPTSPKVYTSSRRQEACLNVTAKKEVNPEKQRISNHFSTPSSELYYWQQLLDTMHTP